MSSARGCSVLGGAGREEKAGVEERGAGERALLEGARESTRGNL